MPYSDKEKTFLDVLYFELKFSDGELREMAKELDRKKLWLYLRKYPEWLRTRVRKLVEGFE